MKISVGLVVLALLGGCGDSSAPQKGFAGLGNQAVAFTPVVPGRVFSFPTDHGVHEGFRIEWWYITANLKDAEGRDFGVQWTLFRSALDAAPQAGGWRNQTLWLGHAAVTSATVHHAAERYARGGVGQAGVRTVPFDAWIDDWQLTTRTAQGDPLATMQLKARDARFSYDLQLTSTRPPVLQGDQGFSQKSEQGQASYYYSQPFFQASGQLDIDGRRYQVSGPAWLDREWSSQPLSENQTGWDWFSLHLDNGEQLMLYRMRHKQGAPYLTGTWIDAKGRAVTLDAGEISLEPLDTADVAGRSMPVRWSIRIPSRQLDITTQALNPDAWMNLRIPYWEGPVQLSGNRGGNGYLEMTGY